MKVVLVILILLDISSAHFISPGMVHNWENSLFGLNFLAYGNYYLDTEMKKAIKLIFLLHFYRNISGCQQSNKEKAGKVCEWSEIFLHIENCLKNEEMCMIKTNKAFYMRVACFR